MKKYKTPMCKIIVLEPLAMFQTSTLGKGDGSASHDYSILSKERDGEDYDDEDLW